jgi:LuxR family maltose regulon positive regulatory protein
VTCYDHFFADLLQLELRRFAPGEVTVRAEAEPAAGMVVYPTRGALEPARGRGADTLAAFRAAERLAGLLVAQHDLFTLAQAHMLHALVRMGETERAEQALAEVGERDRGRGEMRIATAALRLAQSDPNTAAVALAAVLDGSVPVPRFTWLAHAFMLEATARDALGDPAAAERAVERAVERALDLAGPGGALSVHTVRTHVRHLFAKLGAHHRAEAVARARALGLLAPSPSRRAP